LAKSKEEYLRRFSGFTAISEARWSRLAELVDDLDRDGVTVYAYLTPLHPDLVAELSLRSSYRDRRRELVPRLRGLFQGRTDMTFRDASDADAFRCPVDGWYDGAHPMERTDRALLTWLVTGRQ
jgi:hypothetical protein